MLVHPAHPTAAFIAWSIGSQLRCLRPCPPAPQRASASSALISASPGVGGTAAASSCISSMFPFPDREQHRVLCTRAARARCCNGPGSCFHRDVVGHRADPENPDRPRITSRTTVDEAVAGRQDRSRRPTTCAVIPRGKSCSGWNAAESVTRSISRSTSTTGRPSWLSAVARPWPGRSSGTRRTPHCSSPSAARLPQFSHQLGGQVRHRHDHR